MQKILIILVVVLVVLPIIGFLYLKSQNFDFGAAKLVYDNRKNAEPFSIGGNSMSPNYLAGQYWIVDKTVYAASNPQRGDVVIFKDVSDSNKIYAKRIIGLPNEEIEIRDGAVYINGQVLNEQYLSKGVITSQGYYPPSGQKAQIPQDKYFILGDNRGGSSDSRSFGFVPKENIIGKLTTCYKGCTK